MARFILLFILILAAARFLWKLFDVVVRGATGAAPAGARRGGGPFDFAQGKPPGSRHRHRKHRRHKS